MTKDSDSCPHDDTIDNNGTETCVSCGLEIAHSLSSSPEWKSFSEDDHGASQRCSWKRTGIRNIYTELEPFNLSREVVLRANELYLQVAGDKTLRSRKAVIFACVFNAYKE